MTVVCGVVACVALLIVALLAQLSGDPERVGPPRADAVSATTHLESLESLEPLEADVVSKPLDLDADYPRSDLPLPRRLQPPSGPGVSDGGRAVAAVQLANGSTSYLGSDGRWHRPQRLPSGLLHPESLSVDGGALWLRAPSALKVYSTFVDRAIHYGDTETALTGLWANDSVGLFHDIPGPGGAVRGHEGDRLSNTVAFPAGGDLGNVAVDRRNHAVYEFVGTEYLVWSNFQTVGIRRDAASLGDLRRPVAYEGKVAVIRSGSADQGPTGLDGVLVFGADLAPEALLPLAGVDIGDVVLHDFVDASTVLIEAGSRLFTWNHRTDEVRQVADLPAGAVVSISSWAIGGAH